MTTPQRWAALSWCLTLLANSCIPLSAGVSRTTSRRLFTTPQTREGAADGLLSMWPGEDDAAQSVIVVLKEQHHLDAIRGMCQAAADSSDGCGLGGICAQYYSASIAGTAGTFTKQLLHRLQRCLPDGAIRYVELDSSVRKAERSDHEYANWWQWTAPPAVQPDSSSSGTASNAADNTQGSSDEPSVHAFNGEGASVHSKAPSATEAEGQGTYLSLLERWRLAQVGLEAQRQLSGHGGVPAVQAMGRDDPGVFVNPSDIANPGISVPAASGLDEHSAGLPQALDLPGTKVQKLPLALWNLDSLDQRSMPLDRSYSLGSSSTPGTGNGVTIYTVDSGIMPLHQEFKSWADGTSRASYGPDFVDGDDVSEDCDGHGTHVASTAVGRAVGVAKEARVVALRVLDCEGSGTISNVVAALDWVAKNAQRPAIVTLSLGVPRGSWSHSLEDAVRSLVHSNITVVVASGNSAVDSCTIAPARVPEAISVAASNLPGKFSSSGATGALIETLYKWSNTGSCMHIFAPGVDIYAACGGASRCESVTPAAYTWASGTSMSVPHVAGVAALWLEGHPDATPDQVKQAILRAATKGSLESAGMLPGTPNALLYSKLYDGLPAEAEQGMYKGLAEPSMQAQASTGA